MTMVGASAGLQVQHPRFVCRLAHRHHSLEFFTRETEKHCHLFDLIHLHMISLSGTKLFDLGREIDAPHFGGRLMTLGTLAISLSKRTKLAQFHGLTSLQNRPCLLRTKS